MILKVLIVFDPKLNLFKSDAYIFMQQSVIGAGIGAVIGGVGLGYAGSHVGTTVARNITGVCN